MKSRISFFDQTVFKKNLTRFAPAWGLYTIYLLMALVTLMDSGTNWLAGNLCDFVQIQAGFTPCYALLCAQLLFGDLYNTRMCNALHALPLKRETWFATNVASGFVFHLIPTVVFAALAALYAALACYPGDAPAAALWLLGVNLQFICFFGIAVFSAFCVGNRFAQAVVYGIVNFASLIAGWLVNTIFVPMYYGIKIDVESFFWFSPMARMLEGDFCSHTRGYYGRDNHLDMGVFVLGENFGYYFIVAALGIGLMALSLTLYRRRKLECAGDFMALRTLEPVFLVVYTIILGAVFQFAADDIFGMETYLFLFLGLAVGWFTGNMLLERTPRVFRRKNFLRCGILVAAWALILTVAAMDPFGIESWVPEAADVESVTIADGHYNHHQAVLTMEEPADIQKALDIHQEALIDYWDGLEHQPTFEDVYAELVLETKPQDMDFAMAYTFTYRMKNGLTVKRYYHVWMGGDTGQYLKQLSSSPAAVLGYEDAGSFLSENRRVVIRDTWEGLETNVRSQADIQGLYQAILADCEAGTMAQNWNFHNEDDSLYWLYFDSGVEITVFSNCKNTLQWLRDYGLDVDSLLDKKLK